MIRIAFSFSDLLKAKLSNQGTGQVINYVDRQARRRGCLPKVYDTSYIANVANVVNLSTGGRLGSQKSSKSCIHFGKIFQQKIFHKLQTFFLKNDENFNAIAIRIMTRYIFQ